MRNTLEEIYQKVLNEGINQATPQLLEDLSVYSGSVNSLEEQTKIYRIVKKLEIVSHYKKRYINRGVSEREAKILGLLETLQGFPIRQIGTEEFDWSNRGCFYSIDEAGSIIKLIINGIEGPIIWFFPEELCSLENLEVLYFEGNKISQLPDCVVRLKKLKILSLSYNNLTSLPIGLKTLSHLEYLNLQNFSNTFYLDNILDYIELKEFEEEITLMKIEELMAEKLKILEEAGKKPWNFEIYERIYPPEEMLEIRDFEYIILWMVKKNGVCIWEDFTINPLNISQSSLSYHLGDLLRHQHIEKVKNENLHQHFYRITPLGASKLERYPI